MMIKHIKITVKGRVQGVWFRAKTMEKALELGVNGFVKNLINGNVYIEAEGTDLQLQNFISWCKIGPSLANVNEVSEIKGSLVNFTLFEIK